MTRQVLVIDDDPVQRRLLETHVARMGHVPVLRDTAAGGLAALRDDASQAIAAVVLDLVMPGEGGLEVLAEMRRLGHDVPVVVQTARSGIDIVVEAMRAGAFDFVVKPVSPEKLQQTIDKAIRVQEARRRTAKSLREPTGRTLSTPASAAMRPVLALAERAAGSTIPLLIEGETGVGKEWLADAIRTGGPRAKAPFVVVNCGALPATLAESILFGHEKGAFTDAGDRHVGKFAAAEGGTLFLDEIGELVPEIQVKLLRVLQGGEIDAVGGRRPYRPDVRIIAATNRDLATEVAAGRFREDLYYRLNVLPIRIPPLRDRRDEIAGLADRFLGRFIQLERSTPARRFSPTALAMLGRHDWPGNIRQLENAVHRAVVLADHRLLEVDDFPQIAALLAARPLDAARPSTVNGSFYPADGESPLPADRPAGSTDVDKLSVIGADGELRTIEALEADLLRLAIDRYDGRMSEIARRLGIGRSTLYRKLRLYGISEPDGVSAKDSHAQTLRETEGL